MTQTLYPCPVSTSQFSWDPRERTYLGEISSTNGFGRVYPDACDEGLTLVSAKTGRRVVFAIDQTHRDAEGEITHWTLRSTGPEAVAAAWVHVTVTLWND